MTRKRLWVLAGLAGLAAITYAPALSQPFIADDYGNILLARQYGPVSSWTALARDPVHRYRPIFLVLTWQIERVFGLWPPAFYLVSLSLHVLCTWLVFALGAWRVIGWRLSAVAAAFFAVHEGHQEAVMWYSAAYEPLLLVFGLAAFLCWVFWLDPARRRGWHYPAALVCFVLALASKESAVVLAPLMLLAVIDAGGGWRRVALGWAPFAAMALVFALSIFIGPAHHPRLDDGSFSWQAPFVMTMLKSYWRLFWFWGLLSLIGLSVWRARQWRRVVLAGCIWAAVSLVPYSFLVYMNRVPSRQTYLASVGLAWIVAAGLLAVWERYGGTRRWLVALVAAVILAHNIGYLWIKKRPQYLERAAATEALIELAGRTEGPVYVHRFPYPLIVARGAVLLGAGKPAETVVWAPWQVKSQGPYDYVFSLNGMRPAAPGR